MMEITVELTWDLSSLLSQLRAFYIRKVCSRRSLVIPSPTPSSSLCSLHLSPSAGEVGVGGLILIESPLCKLGKFTHRSNARGSYF